MDRADRDRLMAAIEEEFKVGSATQSDILRRKIELETADALLRSAAASERNAKYMLWSVIAAAISALASLGSTVVSAFFHH
jgi:outer membrane protein TolC